MVRNEYSPRDNCLVTFRQNLIISNSFKLTTFFTKIHQRQIIANSGPFLSAKRSILAYLQTEGVSGLFHLRMTLKLLQ